MFLKKANFVFFFIIQLPVSVISLPFFCFQVSNRCQFCNRFVCRRHLFINCPRCTPAALAVTAASAAAAIGPPSCEDAKSASSDATAAPIGSMCR
jgi:hypothetical protein